MKLLSILFITGLLVAVTSVNADPNNPAQAPGLNKSVIYPPRVVSPVKRPPGWDQGRKTGWQGSAVPPGQAKKVLKAKPIYKHPYKKLKIKKAKNANK